MADDTLNHTSYGWPYLDPDNYLRVLPAYTEELADKLNNADADVAAAINAATDAQAAATDAQAAADSVTAQAAQITTNATDIDALEADVADLEGQAGRLPFAMAAGLDTVSVTSAVTNVYVDLPAGRFTQAPRAQAIVTSYNKRYLLRTDAVSTTQFRLTVMTPDGSSPTAEDILVAWQAVQMTSSSADG